MKTYEFDGRATPLRGAGTHAVRFRILECGSPGRGAGPASPTCVIDVTGQGDGLPQALARLMKVVGESFTINHLDRLIEMAVKDMTFEVMAAAGRDLPVENGLRDTYARALRIALGAL